MRALPTAMVGPRNVITAVETAPAMATSPKTASREMPRTSAGPTTIKTPAIPIGVVVGTPIHKGTPLASYVLPCFAKGRNYIKTWEICTRRKP